MSEPTMSLQAEEVLQKAEAAYQKYREQVVADPDYPALHLAPPVGRLNDPNGLVFKDGVYHAFYQFSPIHPTRSVFWRHATSTDLTHWKDDQTAVAPTRWYDKNGCYSGSGIVTPEGQLEFFYTGNVKDEQGNRETYQNLFTSSDNGKTFERYPQNPLISGPAQGYTAHYRDPHVFLRDGVWWAVLGAQRENETGAIVYYTSEDRRHWSFGGEIEFSDPSLNNFGYMFECPVLFPLKDQQTGEMFDVLLFCPQGLEAQGELYNNIFQCGYVVGHLRGNRFEVTTSFTELDAGFEFYAPQVMSGLNQDGASATLLAWMGNASQDDQPSWDNHWVHMLTYPRTLTLSGGKVFQAPVAQLGEALEEVPAELDKTGSLQALAGERTLRVSATADVSAGPVELVIRDKKGEALVLTLASSSAEMNRAGTRYTVGGERRRRTLAEADTHTFDLLVDASATEVFLDDGAESFTARTYFHGAVESISLRTATGESAEGSVKNLRVWSLKKSR